MKKLVICALALLMLVGCSSKKSKADVIDVLLDYGFAKNDAGFYEISLEDGVYRIGYLYTFDSYTYSLKEYLEPGPVIVVESTGANYHPTLDEAYDDILCSYKPEGATESTTGYTELVYSFENQSLVVGQDPCGWNDDNKDLYTKSFDETKEKALALMEKLGLTASDLKTLGD